MIVDLDRLDVVNNVDVQRFEVQLGDALALIDYVLNGDKIVVTHTEVPSAFEAQGIAAKMTQTALDYAEANGLKVVPSCPYTAAYIRKHPEYKRLV